MPPGFRKNEIADESLQRPILLVAEAVGEKVEQRGMARLLSESAEVVHRWDDALAEEVMPDTVHDDAAGEGIFRINKIAGKLEPSRALGRVGSAVEFFEKAPRHGRAGLFVIAADKERLVDPGSLEDSRGAGGKGNVRLKLTIAGHE